MRRFFRDTEYSILHNYATIHREPGISRTRIDIRTGDSSLVAWRRSSWPVDLLLALGEDVLGCSMTGLLARLPTASLPETRKIDACHRA